MCTKIFLLPRQNPLDFELIDIIFKLSNRLFIKIKLAYVSITGTKFKKKNFQLEKLHSIAPQKKSGKREKMKINCEVLHRSPAET